MISKSTRYEIAKFGWGLLTIGGVIVLYTGQAEPYVSPSQLPGTPFYAFAGAVAVAIAGGGVVTVLKTRAWQSAGRRANLTPDGGGLYRKPDLTGSVDGWPVRARVVERKTGSSDEGGTKTTAYTIVEAELNQPAEVGLIVAPASGGRTYRTSVNYEIDPEHADVKDDRLAAVGGPADVAREVISGRSRSALLDLNDLNLLYVGDGAGALSDAMPDMSDSRLGSWMEGKAQNRVPGDASTVTIETKGLILNPGRLERQAEAVAAVAEAFESATGG